MFCFAWFVLIRHIASFQTGLFWLLVPVSQGKKYIKNMKFFPLASFLKLLKWHRPTAITTPFLIPGLNMRSETEVPESTQFSKLSHMCTGLLKAKRSEGGWSSKHVFIQGPRESISVEKVVTTALLISDSSPLLWLCCTSRAHYPDSSTSCSNLTSSMV